MKLLRPNSNDKLLYDVGNIFSDFLGRLNRATMNKLLNNP